MIPGGVDGARGEARLIAVGSEAEVPRNARAISVLDVENDALALAEGAEERPGEGPRGEHHLRSIVVAHDHTDPGLRIVDLDDALHAQTFSTLPALMHDVQTRMRRELFPCFTRTR